MMRGKLNIFQRTVLLWNDMHPYNAVHVLRISRPMDTAKLKNAVGNTLQKHGLVNLVVDPAGGRYEYRGGHPDISIKVVEGSAGASILDQEIQEQLNRPFVMAGPFIPFRFFVMSEDEGFYFGLVYFHMIAGADSVIMLMQEILRNYAGEEPEAQHTPFDLYPEVYRKLMPFSLRNITGWIMNFREHLLHMKKSCRPKYHDPADTSIGFTSLSLSPAQSNALINTAPKWGVTVNDLFLALLLKSLAPLGSRRFRSGRRDCISVASIVNIRKDLLVGEGVFGIFLSYFNVTHHDPEHTAITKLAKDIQLQTEKIKKYRLFLRTVFEMWGALILVRWIFRKRKRSFYAKYNPIWGGITNVNLNPAWNSSGKEGPSYYLRAVSTGHATPLVFSFTTLHDKIHIGISYRCTVFSRQAMERIVSDFSGHVSALTGI